MSGAASNQQAAFGYAGPPYGTAVYRAIKPGYKIQPSDNGAILAFVANDNSSNVSLPAPDTIPVGFQVTILNQSTGSQNVTVQRSNSAVYIDNGQGDYTLYRYNGATFLFVGYQPTGAGTNVPTWVLLNDKPNRAFQGNVSSAGGTATGIDSVVVGSLSTASGNGAIALGYSATASGYHSVALGDGALASSSNSTAIGTNSSSGGSQAVTGAGAMALGGSRASGADSFAAAVTSISSSYGASGASSVAIGSTAKASSSGTIAMGAASIASGQYSVAISAGSSGTQATANNAVAIGNNALAAIRGKYAYSSGVFAANGDAQIGHIQLRCATTDATATVATSNGSTATTNNQVILPDNSAYAFTGTVVSRQQAAGGTASAAWKVEGIIRREGTAASTTLITSTVTAIDNTPGWTLALSADTTNGGLAVTFTGAAATNIRTVAAIDTTEVTYA